MTTAEMLKVLETTGPGALLHMPEPDTVQERYGEPVAYAIVPIDEGQRQALASREENDLPTLMRQLLDEYLFGRRMFGADAGVRVYTEPY